jgi:hypothetical protein
VQVITRPAVLQKRSFTLALTSLSDEILFIIYIGLLRNKKKSIGTLGSKTKERPILESGGYSPVVANRSPSMTVFITLRKNTGNNYNMKKTVFPAPFCPQIRVKGEKNSMTVGSSGLKLRTPTYMLEELIDCI